MVENHDYGLAQQCTSTYAEQCHRHPQDVSRVQRLAEVLRGAHPGYMQSKKRNRQNTLPQRGFPAPAVFSYTLQPGYGSTAAASRPNDLKSVQEAQDRRAPDS